jgi:hypothetical protein
MLAAIFASVAACSKKESLVLLDLRASGPLGAPVAFVRLSSPGGKTRTISGALGPNGFLVGYYGPVQDDAISVTAEALDGVYCALGRGSATVTGLESGATSEATKLFIRPQPGSGCARVDAGGGDQDAGTDTVTQDTGTDTSPADTNTADTSPADTGTAETSPADTDRADTNGDSAMDAATERDDGDTNSGTDAVASAAGDVAPDATTDGGTSDAASD